MLIDKLLKLSSSLNIAEDLDEEELCKIADKVKTETDIDRESMNEWMDRNDEALKIALQVKEEKTFPWVGASDVKFPLITNGALTFAAREYPQIVRGQTVVDAALFGRDQDGTKCRKAKRLSKHMSWQLLVDSDGWEADTDKLLSMIAVVGTVFRKGYFDVAGNKPVFETCRPDRVYINNNVKTLESARRITHVTYSYMNEIIENMNQGLYCTYDPKELADGMDSYNTEMKQLQDSDTAHELLEQHRYLDLDGDGYNEPYIVTYHTASHKILRIVSRYSAESIKLTEDGKKVRTITPDNYFTDYHFLPSPDGKFLSFGLGTLLYPLNQSINTTINQMIDAGSLLNAQPIIMSAMARVGSPEIKLAPGTINRIEGLGSQSLKDSIMNLPLLPPSPVLFSLLQLLLDAGKEIAGITEILTGQQPSQNSPATTVLALIKQGLVQYNAIHKRVLRSFKKEFLLLYKLNSQYLDIEKYLNMMDDPEASIDDYKVLDIDIRPVSDPNMASETQRLTKAQAIYQLPEVDRRAAAANMLQAMDVEDYLIEGLMPPVDPNAPPPPEVQKILAETKKINTEAEGLVVAHQSAVNDLEFKKGETTLKMADAEIKSNVGDSQIRLNNALAVKALADANKAEQESKHVGDKPIKQ